VIYCLAAELLFVHKPKATDEQFEAFLERVMDELDNIGREDTNLGGSLAERTAEFVMDVEADSFEDAVVSMFLWGVEKRGIPLRLREAALRARLAGRSESRERAPTISQCLSNAGVAALSSCASSE
jgi:hypothetical protein